MTTPYVSGIISFHGSPCFRSLSVYNPMTSYKEIVIDQTGESVILTRPLEQAQPMKQEHTNPIQNLVFFVSITRTVHVHSKMKASSDCRA